MSGAGSAVSQEGTGGWQAGRKAGGEDRTPHFEMSEDYGGAAVASVSAGTGCSGPGQAGRQARGALARPNSVHGEGQHRGRSWPVAATAFSWPVPTQEASVCGSPTHTHVRTHAGLRGADLRPHFTGKGFEAPQADDRSLVTWRLGQRVSPRMGLAARCHSV